MVDEETSDEDDAYARAPADSGSSTRLLSVQVMRVLWVLYPRIIGEINHHDGYIPNNHEGT